MTDIQLIAFVIVPIVVVIMGWALAFWAGWVASK
jgi:hypothetical protein